MGQTRINSNLHDLTIRLMQKMGYPSDVNGVCFAIACMAMNAILTTDLNTNDLKTFDDRINAISQFFEKCYADPCFYEVLSSSEFHSTKQLPAYVLKGDQLVYIDNSNTTFPINLTKEQLETVKLFFRDKKALTDENQLSKDDLVSLTLTTGYIPGYEKYLSQNLEQIKQKMVSIVAAVKKEMGGPRKLTKKEMDNLNIDHLLETLASLQGDYEAQILTKEEYDRRVNSLIWNALIQDKIEKKKAESFTEMEKMLLSITDFFDGIEIYQQIIYHPKLLDKSNERHVLLPQQLYTQDYEISSSFVMSSKLKEMGGASEIDNFIGIYLDTDNYLEELANKIEKAGCTVSLLLNQTLHSAVVGYIPSKGWAFIEANQIPTIYKNSLKELFPDIMAGFAPYSENELIIFSTTIYTKPQYKKQLTEVVKDWKNSNEYSVLHHNMLSRSMYLAIEKSDYDYVKLLIKNDINVDEVLSYNGITPILMAVKKQDPLIVELLCHHAKTSLNVADVSGMTPLGQAILNNDIETINKLFQFNADVNQSFRVRNEVTTPLFMSLLTKNSQLTTTLIEKGADITMPCYVPLSSLKKLISAGTGNIEYTKQIINSKNINSEDKVLISPTEWMKMTQNKSEYKSTIKFINDEKTLSSDHPNDKTYISSQNNTVKTRIKGN